jgi:hypothetical protein
VGERAAAGGVRLGERLVDPAEGDQLGGAVGLELGLHDQHAATSCLGDRVLDPAQRLGEVTPALGGHEQRPPRQHRGQRGRGGGKRPLGQRLAPVDCTDGQVRGGGGGRGLRPGGMSRLGPAGDQAAAQLGHGLGVGPVEQDEQGREQLHGTVRGRVVVQAPAQRVTQVPFQGVQGDPGILCPGPEQPLDGIDLQLDQPVDPAVPGLVELAALGKARPSEGADGVQEDIPRLT